MLTVQPPRQRQANFGKVILNELQLVSRDGTSCSAAHVQGFRRFERLFFRPAEIPEKVNPAALSYDQRQISASAQAGFGPGSVTHSVTKI
jgi:hypothetical protein